MSKTLRTHIEKIVNLTDQEFDFINSLFAQKSYKKGQYIFQEGDNFAKHYFIGKGLLKLVFMDNDMYEHIVGFAMEDWWESDFEAFYTQQKTTMSLICLENTDVSYITYENYIKLCNELPKMERFFLEKAYYGFIAAQKRILFTLTSNTKERYQQLLKRYPTLVQRVPKSQLAAYLGVSRETLSRLAL
ncbi:Crp/Fnr family transcriptional regulator [Sphingobacterium sp. SYP-B4668]|uniref:Crp/Fnr family transcriptional regulator n=1 Tax=Sphingobacterium sp. SYP-B4668 TaxID=2996035 RepID=UPI0022DD8FDE|nr:Crp/Fnr family transcriptional regulator [Sphingobacterium sp. SYP-B4668]